MKKEFFEEKEGLKDILEEAEILAELKEEERIRKKNAKLVAFAVIGIVVCGGIFFWAQRTPKEKPAITDEAPPPKEEEVFPEAGKIKPPGEPAQEMKPLREPQASDEDALPLEPKAETAKPPVAPGKPVEKAEKKVAVEKKAETPAAPEKQKEGPKKETKKEAKKEETRAFNIRVGAFVLPDELKQASDKVKALGLLPSTKREKNKIGMHKVLVGPYSTKGAAEKVQGQLQAKLKKGPVVENGGKFYVQIGAFYKKDGAIEMKEQVEKMDFPAMPLFEPTEILCDTLYASGKGTRSEVEKTLNLLKGKGFDAAETVSR
ncbi:MAG: SPOR domain-containing protein [Nitrospinae bacterium]|nr:SPOR domain-containing protein [Nitrospinota bacterium]